MFERMPKYSMSDELGDWRMMMVRLSRYGDALLRESERDLGVLLGGTGPSTA